MPEKARKHLQALVELREQLDTLKAQTEALIETVEADLQRELPDHVQPLSRETRPRKRR